MPKQLNVNLAITADTSKAKATLEQLNKQLQQIGSFGGFKNGAQNLDVDLKKAVQSANQLQSALKEAMNPNTGNIDLTKLQTSLANSNTSLKQVSSNLLNAGIVGEKAFLNVQNAVANANVNILKGSGLLSSFLVTLKNTAKWQISSSILHGFVGSLSSAMGYAQSLDRSLTNIQIVTGQSVDEMSKFAIRANKAAQALSTTTTAYTDAALIFYQQGLNDSEVTERTNATIKMAQVTGDSAKEVSSYMTAIWNNFDNGSESLEHYADVITALGASTASSSAEIAAGLEKFSAVAETIGLSYDYATSALATIVANTRQSADVVGTSLKTLFSRLEGLKLGESLEDGTDLNKYSKALETVGVSIKDQNGELKNMDAILDEMAAKWETLSKDQQVALAQTVGGVRQYNTLISLMDNWDDMQENLRTASAADGNLQKQADIYADSWQAAKDRVKAATQEIYNSLIDADFFKKADNALAGFLNIVSSIINGLGGVKGVILLLSNLLINKFSANLTQSFNNGINKIKDFSVNFSNIKNTVSGTDSVIKNTVSATQNLANSSKNVTEEVNKQSEAVRVANLNTSNSHGLWDKIGSKINVVRGLVGDYQIKCLEAERVMVETAQQASLVTPEFERQTERSAELLRLREEYVALGKDLSSSQQEMYAALLQEANITSQALYEAQQKVFAHKDEREMIIESVTALKETEKVQQEINAAVKEQLSEYIEIKGESENLEDNLAEILRQTQDLSALNTLSGNFKDAGIQGKEFQSIIKQIISEYKLLGGVDSKISKSLLKINGPKELQEEIKNIINDYQILINKTKNYKQSFSEIKASGATVGRSILEAMGYTNQWNTSVTKLKQNFQQIKVPTIGQQLSQGLSSLTSGLMAINTLKNAFDQLGDSEVSVGQKLLNFTMGLSMMIGPIMNGINTVKEFIAAGQIMQTVQTTSIALTEAENAVTAKEITLKGTAFANGINVKKQKAEENALKVVGITLSRFNLSAKEQELVAEEMLNVAKERKIKTITQENFSSILETALKRVSTKVTEEQTVAQWSLNAAMEANPIGMIILGLTALIGVITAVVSLINKHTQSVEEANEALDKYNENVKSFNSENKNFRGNKEELESIKEEYEKLSEKAGDYDKNIDNLTDEEKKRYQEIKDKIIELNDQAVLYYDAEGNAILKKNEGIEKTLELLEEEIRLKKLAVFGDDAAVETDKAYGTLYSTAEKNLTDAEKNKYFINGGIDKTSNYTASQPGAAVIEDIQDLLEVTQHLVLSSGSEYDLSSGLEQNGVSVDDFNSYLQDLQKLGLIKEEEYDINHLSPKQFLRIMPKLNTETGISKGFLQAFIQIYKDILGISSDEDFDYLFEDVTESIDYADEIIGEVQDNIEKMEQELSEASQIDPSYIIGRLSVSKKYGKEYEQFVETAGEDGERLAAEYIESILNGIELGQEVTINGTSVTLDSVEDVFGYVNNKLQTKNDLLTNNEIYAKANKEFQDFNIETNNGELTQDKYTEKRNDAINKYLEDTGYTNLTDEEKAVVEQDIELKFNMTGIIINDDGTLRGGEDEYTAFLNKVDGIINNSKLDVDGFQGASSLFTINQLENEEFLNFFENELPNALKEGQKDGLLLNTIIDGIIDKYKFLQESKDWMTTSEDAKEATTLNELDRAMDLSSVSTKNQSFDEAYTQNLLRIGEGYESCTNEAKEYEIALKNLVDAQEQLNSTIDDGMGSTTVLAQRVLQAKENVLAMEDNLRAMIMSEEAASKYGLSQESLAAQARELRQANEESAEGLELNAQQAMQLAISNQRMNKGLAELNKNWDTWKKTLTSTDKTSQDYADTLVDLSNSVEELVGWYEDLNLSSKFVEKNMDLIEKAASGDTKAIMKLGAEVAKTSVQEAKLNTTLAKGQKLSENNANNAGEIAVEDNAFQAYKESLGELTTEAQAFESVQNGVVEGLQLISDNMDALTEGTSLADVFGNDDDLADWINKLNAYAAATGMTAEEMQAMLSSVGVTADVKTDYQEQTVTVPTYEEHSVQIGTETYTGKALNGDPMNEEHPVIKRWSVPGEPMTTTGYVAVASIDMGGDAKPPTFSGKTPPAPSSTGGKGKGGGGGGGGSSKKSYEGKRHTDTHREKYDYLNKNLESTKNAYNKVSEAAEHAFGAEKLKLLDKQIEKQKEVAKATQKVAAESKRLADLEKNNLKNGQKNITAYYKDAEGKEFESIVSAKSIIGKDIKFDNYGNISNYKEIKEALDDYNNKAIDKYNKSNQDDSDKTALEKVKAEIAAVEEALSDYDSHLAESISDADAYLDELYGTYSLVLEKTQEAINIKINVEDSKLEYLEYLLGKVEDDAYSAADAIRLLGAEANANLNKTNIIKQGIVDIINGHNNEAGGNLGFTGETFLNALTHYDPNNLQQFYTAIGLKQDQIVLSKKKKNGQMMNDDELFAYNMKQLGLTQEEIDALKESASQLLELNKSNEEIVEKVFEIMESAFDTMLEDMDKVTAKMQHQQTMLEHYQNIVGILGQKNTKITDEMIRNNSKAQVKAATEVLLSTREKMKKIQDEIARAEAQRDIASDEDKEKWDDLIDHMKESLSEVEEEWGQNWEDALNKSVEDYNLAISQVVENMKEVMGTNGLRDAYDKNKEIDEDYVADYEKIYQLTKLTRKVTEDINKASGLGTKQKLLAYEQEINDLLQSDAELSQYDIEYAQKKLGLLEAEMALRDAQNNKSSVRMVADAEGNYGYVYTADQTALDKAQEDYEQKLYELQKANDEYQKKVSDSIMSVNEEYLTQFQEIHEKYEEGSEEYNQAMTRLQTWYTTQMTYYGTEMEKVTNNNISLYEKEWKAYSLLTGYKISMEDKYVDHFEETVLGKLLAEKGYSSMSEFVQACLQAAEDGAGEGAKLFQELLGNNDLINDIATSGQGVEAAYQQGTDTANTENDKAINELDKLSEKVQKNWQKILADTKQFEENYSSEIEAAIKENEDLAKSMIAITQAWSGMKTDLGLKDAPNIVLVSSGISNEDKQKIFGMNIDEESIMATGGYTGSWGGDSGRLALLHQKELVLNAMDTENLLSAIGMVRQISRVIDINANNLLSDYSRAMSAVKLDSGSQQLEQNVHITAEFPNATNRDEIRAAFENLTGLASQYINRK